MARVITESQRANRGIDADVVHDLRVALRRCRSIADGFMAFDPDRTWQDMKRESKRLFKGLGDLRDTHVMLEWCQRLSAPGDTAAAILTEHLARQEQLLKESALDALQHFDDSKWLSWSDQLPMRTERIPVESPVFQHLALERWQQAYELHRTALRNRSEAGFHNLRIGLKRFRYTIENFLPSRLDEWIVELKEMQDLLGDNHDLFVLWRTALRIGALRDRAVRSRWHAVIVQEREQRLARYREQMCGPGAMWKIWRAGLPAGNDVRTLAVARLGVWAAYRDPDVDHSRHVALLAGQLLARLDSRTHCCGMTDEDAGSVLQAAALLHDVGRVVSQKDHHRISARMIRKLTPPLGLGPAHIKLIALIVRYHRGALPRTGHVRLGELSEQERRSVVFLAGILRLANAFDMAHNGRVRRLQVQQGKEVILIHAYGYLEHDPLAQNLACARHLLEMACRMPVWFESATQSELQH